MHHFQVNESSAGQRLDIYLADQFPEFSRAQLRKAIVAEQVRVDGQIRKAAFKVQPGHVVEVDPIVPVSDGPTPEDIPLEILFEDEHLVAVNKPPAMVVHPARGNWSGTLTNALAHRFQTLSDAGGASRPGIVHRLDRDTSGVILVAKTNTAHYALAELFQQRQVKKRYTAIVTGLPDRDADRIEQPIGPHPYQREKMAIRTAHPAGKDAESFYEVRRRFRRHALVDVHPKTGRTHQIRVHLAHIGHPVLCDRLYGGHAQVRYGELLGNDDSRIALSRQALHAAELQLPHPLTGQPLLIQAELPADLQLVLDLLNQDTARSDPPDFVGLR